MMSLTKRFRLRTARKRALGLVMLFFACYMASAPMVQTFADPLPPTEVQALTQWTNWVTANCGTIPPPSSGGTPSTGSGGITVDNSAAQQTAQKASTGTTKVGYALYDSTGKQLAKYNESFENYGASITKSMLLVAYLKQVGSGTLSSQAKSELTNMIENSDNASADWVYSNLNHANAAVNGVASSAGMTGFHLDTSDPVYVLGQSQITADDFARFFAKIDTMFPATQKDFALNLLSNLSSADQNGLLKVGLPGTVYSKEGWKSEPDTTNPFGNEGSPYIVNQAAQFSSNGTTYGVAVTVGGTSDQAAGETIVKDVVSSLVGSSGSGTPDTTAGGCACTAGASDTSGDISGKASEKDIWDYFKGKGLSDEQVAGVLGNIDDETGGTYDPQIVEGGGRSKTQPKTGGADGWGLVQWTYPQQDVQQIFNDYKDKYKLSGNLYDSQTQLDIIWAQMNETSPTGVNNMVRGLKGINNPGLAATYFSDNFEGGVPGSRISDALIIYNKYKGTGPSGGGGAAGSTVTTSDTLNGHKLPATVGGTGQESFFPSYALGSPANQNEDNFYITMRWRYAKWNWDGTSVPGPEDIGFYQKHPKVLVTNPRNHKSIIAIALEAGPAPWTGVDSGPNNTPKEGWTNPQDGTPPQYKGRVSGFPPPGIQALGAIQEMNDGATGDKLEFAWAPDQNAKPGPTDLSVDNVTSSTSCATVGSGSNDDIVKVAQQELALGLVGTGPLSNGGPVCKYQGSGCPQAWCADFVSWVYKAAGKPFTGGSDGGWRLSLASDVTGYFLSRKSQPDIGYGTPSGGDTMEPGWAVSFSGAEPGARGIGHVGIVTAVHGNSFDDIEGNGSGSGVSQNKNLPMSSAIDWGGYK